MSPNRPSKLLADWAKQSSFDYEYFKEVDSTNLEAIRQRKTKSSLKLFIAEKQSAGRGRQGATWKDSDLMMSLLVKKPCSFQIKNLDSLLIEACCESAKTVWSELDWRVKKPNDLFIENKKHAGLLLQVLEELPCRYFILGFGMNLISPARCSRAGYLEGEGVTLKESDLLSFITELFSLWLKIFKIKKAL